MKLLFSTTVFLVLTLTALPFVSNAQIEETCPNLKPTRIFRRDAIENSPSVREQLIKLCIKENKKEFEELVARSEEIEKLSGELKASFEENNSFSDTDREKLEALEKLIKKVRGELRASDDDDPEDEPKSVLDAIKTLQEISVDLAKEIKKTTRHSVSLVAVRSSNTAMRIVKFLRMGN